MRARHRPVTGISIACGLVLSAAPFLAAPAKKPRPPAAPRVTAAMRAAALRKVNGYLEDSVGGALYQPGALVPVFEQLYRLASGLSRDPVHIIHYGDSHTAADEWTNDLRDSFKEKFGDGGSGFSLAGRPFLGYRRFDARGGSTALWHSNGFRSAGGDGLLGLGGMSITADRPGQSVYLDAECDFLEVHYLQQPGGGTLALYDSDQFLEEIPTAGELGPGFVRYQVSPGLHRFTLKTLDSHPVRLFGWVADKQTGVTYEALGINGAEASVIMKWDENLLATYLQRRDPGMIVLAYGTNEASDPNWVHEDYEALFSSLLQRLRHDAPAASILVLGPGDRWARVRGVWHVLDGVDRIVAAEQAACRENGCTFWDARQRMGGKGSMRDWVYAGLAQADYVHFTAVGYHRLAEALYTDLMRQYETYRRTRLEITDQIPYGPAK
ncbi:MAG: SGNH/GDSL hydrolase family protein [Bryobacteraceae bacterium]